MTAPPGPAFLSIEDVRLLHSLAALEFGGQGGLRDEALLESALAQPKAMLSDRFLHQHPFEMAAAYAYHLCQNHPFRDGNKRVAWTAMRTFLHREGFHLRVNAEDAVALMLAVARGNLPKNVIATWVTERALSRPRMELRDFFFRMTPDELIHALTAIADSYRSGGAVELTAIVAEASDAMPVVAHLAALYEFDRSNNEQAIHYIQLLAALHRLAEDAGYEW